MGWSNLGEALTLLNDGQSNTEARAAFAEALTRDGDDLTALFYSAKILTADGRFDEARRIYGHVQAQLAPDDGRRETVAAELAGARRMKPRRRRRRQCSRRSAAWWQGLRRGWRKIPKTPTAGRGCCVLIGY